MALSCPEISSHHNEPDGINPNGPPNVEGVHYVRIMFGMSLYIPYTRNGCGFSVV